MAEEKKKAVNGIRRTVTFAAWCHRCPLNEWSGPPRDTKWLAAWDLAQHDVDRHGGAIRAVES